MLCFCHFFACCNICPSFNIYSPGTRNVLTTCKASGVKKVVLTSSMAAIYATYGTLADDHVYDELTWSPRDLVREKGNWYCLSKTLAEELAWEMSREEDSPFQLVTVNPVWWVLCAMLAGNTWVLMCCCC
jgi:nucleoside-diphosphate-sugar epimerase